MNAGQEKFLNFIMERVQEAHKTAAKELLLDNFQSQAAGTYTREQMAKTQETLTLFLKPEAVGEVTAVMANFASQMK